MYMKQMKIFGLWSTYTYSVKLYLRMTRVSICIVKVETSASFTEQLNCPQGIFVFFSLQIATENNVANFNLLVVW